MLRKLLVFTLLFVLATGLLVACGGEEDDEDEEDSSAGQESAKAGETQKSEAEPIAAVQVAYKNTVAEETARIKYTMVTSGMPAGAANGEGPESMEFRMNGGGVMELSGEKARMTMGMGPLGSFQLRMLEDTMYLKMPQEMQTGAQGMKPWIKTDLDTFYEQQYGASSSEMQANNPTDPTKQLEALKDVGSVEKVGREKIRGASTTHYRAVMDFEKLAEQSGPEAEKVYRDTIEQMGTSKLPTEVWIDDQGRARKFEMDMTTTVPVPEDPTADPAAGGATTQQEIRTVMVQEIYDFGVPVEVSPPPEESTMSMEQFEKQMQQQMEQQQAAPAA